MDYYTYCIVYSEIKSANIEECINKKFNYITYYMSYDYDCDHLEYLDNINNNYNDNDYDYNEKLYGEFDDFEDYFDSIYN